MSYTVQPISIIINYKLITPPAISTLREFSLSQNRQPTLAQPNFHTLYETGQYSLKHKLFSDLWVSYDRWDLQPYIFMLISRKSFTVFNWQTFQKCQLFIETPGIGFESSVVLIQSLDTLQSMMTMWNVFNKYWASYLSYKALKLCAFEICSVLKVICSS